MKNFRELIVLVLALVSFSAFAGEPPVPPQKVSQWKMFLDCQDAQDKSIEVYIAVESSGEFNSSEYEETYLAAELPAYTLSRQEFFLRQVDFQTFVLKDRKHNVILDCIRPTDGGATGSN